MRIKGWAAAVTLLMLSTAIFAQESNAKRERRAATGPVGEATVTINEQFLNAFLTAMFDNLNEPAMPLTVGGAQSSPNCASEIRLKRENASTRTAVNLENGKIAGTLAFAGAYNQSLMGCIQFTGSANTDVDLSYDANHAPAMLDGPLLSMVQSAIDRRYNPVEVFTLNKLSTRVEIQPAGGALQLRAKEVRPEVTPAGITLHITYEFVKG